MLCVYVPAVASTDHYEVPCLLHIVHPRALVNLKQALSNVRDFRSTLGSLTTRGENSQIAKDVLVDLVDCSGVDLNALNPLLDEFILKSKGIEGKIFKVVIVYREVTIRSQLKRHDEVSLYASLRYQWSLNCKKTSNGCANRGLSQNRVYISSLMS